MSTLGDFKIADSPEPTGWLRVLAPAQDILAPALSLLVLLAGFAAAEWGPPARVGFALASTALLFWLLAAVSRRIGRHGEEIRAARDQIDRLARVNWEALAKANEALASDNARLHEERLRGLREREELLATISHELKNSLAVVDVYASLALRHMDSSEVAGFVQRDHLEKIQGSAGQMSRLIQDILDLEKMKAGTFVPARQPESAIQLVRGFVESMEPLAARKSIRVSQTYPDTDRLFNLDRDAIGRVITNLLLNAVKFVPEGGEIRVSAEFREHELVIRVADTGPGIAPGELPYVFDRFWQSRDTAKHGSGLGLAIVRGIVTAHGGRVEAESRPGHGAVFTVVLPSGN